jgi:hypothetical protein
VLLFFSFGFQYVDFWINIILTDIHISVLSTLLLNLVHVVMWNYSKSVFTITACLRSKFKTLFLHYKLI